MPLSTVTSSEIISDANADLYRYPEPDQQHPAHPDNQLTIGDLHGNALKLIYFLLRQNVLVISPNDYAILCSIYKKPTETLTRSDLNKFNQIIAKAKINPVGTVRLIGDELVDRGMNDYFTLKVFEKLAREKVPVEILFSNHGIEFIEAMEKKTNFEPPRLSGIFSTSLTNLKKLIFRNLVSEDEINYLYQHCYKQYLNPLSYTRSENGITIFSHAGMGLETIHAMAAKLKINFNDATVDDLATTIDEINSVVKRDYIDKDRVHELYSNRVMFDGYSGAKIDPVEHPFEFSMWNRHYKHLERPETHNGYKLGFVHGHDSNENSFKNVTNLDNILGKALEVMAGLYQVLYSREQPSPRIKNIAFSTANPPPIKPENDKKEGFFERHWATITAATLSYTLLGASVGTALYVFGAVPTLGLSALAVPVLAGIGAAAGFIGSMIGCVASDIWNTRKTAKNDSVSPDKKSLTTANLLSAMTQEPAHAKEPQKLAVPATTPLPQPANPASQVEMINASAAFMALKPSI